MLIGIFEKAMLNTEKVIEMLLELLDNMTTDNTWIYHKSVVKDEYETHTFKEINRNFTAHDFLIIDNVINTIDANRTGLTIVMSPKTEKYLLKTRE